MCSFVRKAPTSLSSLNMQVGGRATFSLALNIEPYSLKTRRARTFSSIGQTDFTDNFSDVFPDPLDPRSETNSRKPTLGAGCAVIAIEVKQMRIITRIVLFIAKPIDYPAHVIDKIFSVSIALDKRHLGADRVIQRQGPLS